jgi:crotonobetainyl-CoA:carnitine CoA-transferase CaiB-like acyl-CoA transferase
MSYGIYVRGTGFGARGPDAGTGGYDSTAFWARGGSADSAAPDGAGRPPGMPAGAYGDNVGGMTIAGGIAAALYARAVTGEASVIDVSLLGVGAWAAQFSVNLALLAGGPLPRPERGSGHGSPGNPLAGTFRTADGRWVMLSMLQPARYWPEFCRRMGRPALIADPRFAGDAILGHGLEGGEIVAEIIGGLTLDRWRTLMDGAEGQWAPVQNTYEVGMDPALRENGFVATVTDYEGRERELVTNPVQFDETPAVTRRAPQFAEHTDEIMRELGKTDDELLALKLAGAIT